MDNIFVFLTIFLILPTIEAKCSDKNDVHSFGDNCRFMCHCEQNTECNETTGECSNGCARGWYGPGCQYRDIIDHKFSKHSNNSYSNMATDGKIDTCYREVKSNRTEQLFWSVVLSINETIHEIQISTKAKSLVYFKNFTVFVGYSRLPGSYDTVYEQRCFRQGHDIPKTSTFIVLCKKPVIGNVVKIELAQSQNVLELCDVKINGGRNLAFKRNSAQSSKFERCGSLFCKSSFAVDGYASTKDIYFCSLTGTEENPWWQMYIDYKITIWNIEIIDSKYHEQIPYVVHITNTNDTKIGKEGPYRTKVVPSDTHTQSITMNSVGKFVTISVEGKRKLSACEVFVFGDCRKNRCGYNCEKKCQCNNATIWDKLSGNCAISCVQKEKGYQCNMPCEKDDDCTFKCGENCFGGDCNPESGECTKGCKPGLEGTFCKNKCQVGVFGEECKHKCPYNCQNNVCDHVNGNCTQGCKSGYIGNTCSDQCQVGMFGEECKYKCPSNCQNSVCDHVNGNCTQGCKSGHIGNTCSEQCLDGMFGVKCKYECPSNCKNKACDHVNGMCTQGCTPGYIGNVCRTQCLDGMFGVKCKYECPSNCKNKVCDHINGNCTQGCTPGYIGNVCRTQCKNGFYGENCTNQCKGHCKEGEIICRHKDGHCLSGCKTGWNGEKCDSKCMKGKFGKDCKENCPSNCNNDVCNFENGDCIDRCKPGYQGNKCEEISDNILSDAKLYTGSNEARKPDIVLICVGILCAILVVYATVITILFKRKTTHNVKVGTNVSCSGRSNDDAITSKSNKTETVTAEAATEAATELARVNINVIHDESHQYTDLTPDTEDVEAAYETIQLD